MRVEAVSARGIADAPAIVHVTPLTSGVKASSPPVSAMSPRPQDNTLVVRSLINHIDTSVALSDLQIFQNGNLTGLAVTKR